MIAFMLYNARMESLSGASNFAPVQIETAIANMKRTFDETAQPRHRKTSLPPAFDHIIHDLDAGIDEHGQRRGVIEAFGFGQSRIAATFRRLKHDHAQGHMDLRRLETRTVGVDHGLDHVGDQATYFGRARIRNLLGLLRQDGMTHPCYL